MCMNAVNITRTIIKKNVETIGENTHCITKHKNILTTSRATSSHSFLWFSSIVECVQCVLPSFFFCFFLHCCWLLCFHQARRFSTRAHRHLFYVANTRILTFNFNLVVLYIYSIYIFCPHFAPLGPLLAIGLCLSYWVDAFNDFCRPYKYRQKHKTFCSIIR